MRIRESEISKTNSEDIVKLESLLSEVDKYEHELLDSFDKYLDVILGDITKDILEVVKSIPNVDKYELNRIRINDVEYIVPKNFLKIFHKSQISDPILKTKYEQKVKQWFINKTEQIKNGITNKDSYDDILKMMPPSFALASLAVTAFNRKPNVILNDVQKLAGIAVLEGDFAELENGEGKTLANVLPVYLQALRGKGAHVITANNYLAKRDYEETLPIFEGLGLTSSYLPFDEREIGEIEGNNTLYLSHEELARLAEKLKIIKREAYKSDITYGSRQTFVLDYLNDNSSYFKENIVQRLDKAGFVLIDEVDQVLTDDSLPYTVSKASIYQSNMTLKELCSINKMSYENVFPLLQKLGINGDKLTYEEARYLANNYSGKDLLPSQEDIQEFVQQFFEHQKILKVEENRYGFSTGKELFNAILDESKYDSELLRKTYGIISCGELQQYRVSDKCYEDLLKQLYFAFQINSQLVACQDKLRADSNYKEGEDYSFVGNRIRLTLNGANKILNDDNYLDIFDNYNRYLSTIGLDASIIYNYFNKAVEANLLMKNGEDYIVDSGKVKIVKETNLSNGLLSALEVKEKIAREYRTKEPILRSTVSQGEYYSRYDIVGGITGTSSNELFREVYGKSTLVIPRQDYYSFYGNRKQADAKEPVAVKRKNMQYSLDAEGKYQLIVNSIIESHNSKQPVLLVVSNDKEIAVLSRLLVKNGINPTVITHNDSKELMEMKYARIGMPSNVTLASIDSCKGETIKLGGDRETLIDIETLQHIASEENKNSEVVHLSVDDRAKLRDEVEKYLMDMGDHICWSKEVEEKRRNELSSIGVKVILSGISKLEREDRQIEDQLTSGVFESYACPSDLQELGIISLNSKESVADTFSKIPKNPDGSLILNDAQNNELMNIIDSCQNNFENNIKVRLLKTQNIDGAVSKLVESYRNQRNKIVCGEINIDSLVSQMIDKAADGIIASFVANKNINKDNLKLPIPQNGLGVDVEAISLEAKRVLGISFNSDAIIKANMSLNDLKDALIKTAMERFKSTNADAKKALLIECDYLIENIPLLLDQCFTVKRLTSISGTDANNNLEFIKIKRSLIMEACKEGAKAVIGIPLTKDEFKNLETKKVKISEYVVFKSENKEEADSKPKRSESLIERFKRIKERLAASEQRQLERNVQTNETTAESVPQR